MAMMAMIAMVMSNRTRHALVGNDVVSCGEMLNAVDDLEVIASIIESEAGFVTQSALEESDTRNPEEFKDYLSGQNELRRKVEEKEAEAQQDESRNRPSSNRTLQGNPHPPHNSCSSFEGSSALGSSARIQRMLKLEQGR